jgi:hypothetical protein
MAVQWKGTRCPYCSHEIRDAEAAEGEEEPRPGDLVVCASCIEVCAFDEEMRLVKPTEKQLEPYRRLAAAALAKLAKESAIPQEWWDEDFDGL